MKAKNLSLEHRVEALELAVEIVWAALASEKQRAGERGCCQTLAAKRHLPITSEDMGSRSVNVVSRVYPLEPIAFGEAVITSGQLVTSQDEENKLYIKHPSAKNRKKNKEGKAKNG